MFIRSGDFSSIRPYVSGYTGKPWGLSDPQILVPFVLMSQGIQVNTGLIRSGDFSSIRPDISAYSGKPLGLTDPQILVPFVLMSQGIQVNLGVYMGFLENLGYLNSILSFICIPS